MPSSRGGAQIPMRTSASFDERSMQSNQSVVDTLDFPAIEERDPALAEGYRVVYDREVPIEFRVQDSIDSQKDAGTRETLRCKILALGEEQCPQHFRIELTSENDIFFHYTHVVDEHGFRVMQENQKLMIAFPDYDFVVIKMLNNCIKEPHRCLAAFVMLEDGHARLDFIQNMEYKLVELLQLNFHASPEEVVRKNVVFRYNSTKSRLAMMEARLEAISALVKVKNPSLLHQLQKTTARGLLKR